MIILYFLPLFFFIIAPIKLLASHDQPFTIMIEPAGDAKHAGRTIDDCFERGITLQYAEELKKVLEKKKPGVRVILSRFPGESLEPLQNAHFANRLGINLYISIHFFQGKEGKQTVYLYHFLYNQLTDYWPSNLASTNLIPLDQVHRNFLPTTKIYAQLIAKTLRSSFNNSFEVQGIFGLPFKPLIGIAAPALAFEASIASRNDWKLYVEPIAQSLKNIIEQANI